MTDITSTIRIANELNNSGITDKYFFPLDEKNLFNIKKTFSKELNSYLDTNLNNIKTNKYFDLITNSFYSEEILTIEIGGSKTTVQLLQIVAIPTPRILPIKDAIVLKTIQPPPSKNISYKDFISWICEIINLNKKDTKKIAINLAGAVDSKGKILLTPPNIYTEDLTGKNIIKDLNKELPELIINIFNDSESLIAAQYFYDKKNLYNIFIDINGTGNNSSVLKQNNIVQNLESGHAKCVPIYNTFEEIEEAVSGRRGIERMFNKIAHKNNLSTSFIFAPEIYDLAFSNGKDIINKLAFLTYERAFFYKALSFISLDNYFRNKKEISNKQTVFILFGGINKAEKTIPELKKYLDFFQSDIQLDYCVFGEEAGRYGAAILANSSHTF
ncbi:MAG: hypothetical protein WCJ19_04155 [bacterium]